MVTNEEISAKIKQEIKARGIKRIDLSNSIGIDKFTLDNWLDCKAKWDVVGLIKIIDYLNMPVDELFGLKDDKEYQKKYREREKEIHELKEELKRREKAVMAVFKAGK